MFEEDDRPRPKPARLAPPALDPMPVVELQLYLRELRGEIARVEAEIARKEAVRNAAAAFFRTP